MSFNFFNNFNRGERKSNGRLRFILISVICGLLTIVIINIVYAWTNPSANPPSGGGALYYYNGNIGIATTTPSYKLDIQIGETELSGLRITDPNSNLVYLGDGAADAEAGILQLWDSNGSQSVQIYAGAANSWLGINGNVGIGT
ncbi:MAG: hypothetical protein AB1465_07290, partial [Patescibacteria group bacterium]